MLRSLSVGKRIIAIIVFMVLFICATCVAFLQSFDTMKGVSLREINDLMYEGQEAKLKAAADGLAGSLSHALQDLPDTGAKVAFMQRALKEHRFEEDKSGYFFVFEGTVMVAHVSESLHGKDLAQMADKNGVFLMQDLAKAASEGGGFVEYIWEKPGAGDQPKLSYATPIPGTNYALGTGIYIDNIQREKSRVANRIDDIVRQSTMVIMGSLMVALLGVIVLSLFIVRSIIGPIREATGAAETIARGDYSVELDVRGKDEAAILQQSLNIMAETLRDNIEKITIKTREAEEKAQAAEQAMKDADQARAEGERARKEGTLQAAERIQEVVDRVSAASNQIATQSEVIGRGTAVQHEQVQGTATAMEEMNATVLEVAKNASEASVMGMRAKDLAGEGAGIVNQSVEAMNTTYTAAEDLKTGMNRLGEQADDIGKVMEVITDIADQTNLLALNAAIEAARAGEAGRGFAVVADEVRKLAEKTMQATKEVGDSISAVQDVAQQNISGMEKALGDLGSAVDLSNRSGDVLKDIVIGAEESASQIQSIATAAEEQSATSEEINRAIEQISIISNETSEGVAQSSDALLELASQMSNLQSVIDGLVRDAEA